MTKSLSQHEITLSNALHICRNPFDWTDEAQKTARLFLCDEISRLTTERDSARNSLHVSERGAASLSDDIAAFRTTNKGLVETLEAKNEELEHAKTLVKEYGETIEQLQNELSSSKACQSELAIVKADVEHLNKAFEGQIGLTRSWKSQAEELKKQNDELERCNLNQSRTIEEFQNKYKAQQDFRLSFEAKKSLVTKLREILRRKNARILEADSENERLKCKVYYLTTENKELEQCNLNQSNTIAAYQEGRDNTNAEKLLTEDNARLERKVKVLQERNDAQAETIARQRKTIRDKDDMIRRVDPVFNKNTPSTKQIGDSMRKAVKVIEDHFNVSNEAANDFFTKPFKMPVFNVCSTPTGEGILKPAKNPKLFCGPVEFWKQDKLDFYEWLDEQEEKTAEALHESLKKRVPTFKEFFKELNNVDYPGLPGEPMDRVNERVLNTVPKYIEEVVNKHFLTL